MPKLENWSIVLDNESPFLAPELRRASLQGNVYGHERFEDDTYVHTSSIQELDIKNNIAKTRNTTYELGKPSEEYINYLNDNGKSLEDYIR